jgi:hypothetical protein
MSARYISVHGVAVRIAVRIHQVYLGLEKT